MKIKKYLLVIEKIVTTVFLTLTVKAYVAYLNNR